MLDTDGSGKLGLEEFKNLLLDVFTWKVCVQLLTNCHPSVEAQ